MLHSIRRTMATVALGVCVLVPQAAHAVSKMAVSVQGKTAYTITARLDIVPPAGQTGEFAGTVVDAGKLPPDASNTILGLGRLEGVAFTRLSADTVTAVDGAGRKFWIISKVLADKTSATITDGTDILAKAEFSGVWSNDAGEAGAQSIPLVLASFFAQQAVAANDPPKPSIDQCYSLPQQACTHGTASWKYTWPGTCEFTCKPAPPKNPQ